MALQLRSMLQESVYDHGVRSCFISPFFNFPGLLGTSGSVVPVAFHNIALLSIRDARAAFFVIVLCLHWPLVVFVFVHVGLPCNLR